MGTARPVVSFARMVHLQTEENGRVVPIKPKKLDQFHSEAYSKRADFIYRHLKLFLQTSEKLGIKPMGYLHWSLMDNFEWLEGRRPRFGLFEVNYETMARTARPSAYYFSEIGRQKALFSP